MSSVNNKIGKNLEGRTLDQFENNKVKQLEDYKSTFSPLSSVKLRDKAHINNETHKAKSFIRRQKKNRSASQQFSPPTLEHISSLPCSQQPATAPCPDPDEPVHILTLHFFKIYFNIIKKVKLSL
jgi:hypothetical protein